MTIHLETTITYILFIVGFLIVLWAQSKVNRTFQNYRHVKTKNKISGVEVARKILDANELSRVHVVETKGELTDHYDPKQKVVRLSQPIFQEETIAAVAVAAHEVGHAIQDKEGYGPMKIRSMLVPVVNMVTYIGYFVSIISLVAGITAYIKIGIMIIMATLMFQLVTLPVEFDASKRALIELQKLGLIEPDEQQGTRNMLKVAAMTYVASFINTVLNLLRLLIMSRDRD